MSRRKSNTEIERITANRLGLRIREQRELKSISAHVLADTVGVSHHHIVRIEKGDELPSLSLFIAIVFTLDCSADDLLFDYLQEQGNPWREDNFCRLIQNIPSFKRESAYNICKEYGEYLRRK